MQEEKTDKRRAAEVGHAPSDECEHEPGGSMAEERKESASTTYEIRIKGHLDERWADWLAGLTFTHEIDGTTTLRGVIADQAALHGLLNGIRDLGLPLISVQQVSPNRETRSG